MGNIFVKNFDAKKKRLKRNFKEAGFKYVSMPEVGIANFFLGLLIANPLIFFVNPLNANSLIF
jgi:hypothetical protein